MSSFNENETGAVSAAAGLEDAKASGPTSFGTSLLLKQQSPIGDAVRARKRNGIPSAHVQPPADMNGAKVSVMIRELSSGRLGDLWFDEFLLKPLREVGDKLFVLDPVELTRLQAELENAGVLNVREQALRRAVDLVAADNPHDCARERLKQLPKWDGVRRIEDFLTVYLGVKPSPFARGVSRYIWSGMLAGILSPGSQLDMVPILVGAQGTHKRSALRAMVLEADFYGDARLTDRPDRLFRKFVGTTLVGWEFIRGIKGRSDSDDVKAMISCRYFERPDPNGEGMIRYLRRFFLMGTSNTWDFLKDQSGNRRFLPFTVGDINVAKLLADREQLWAEGLAMVQERASQGLSLVDFYDAERFAPDEHQKFKSEGRWVNDADLHRFLLAQVDPFTVEDALNGARLSVGRADISHSDRIAMGKTLEQLGCRKGSARAPGFKNPQPRWHPDNVRSVLNDRSP